MVSDLSDFSAVQKYDPSTTYSAEAKVFFDGIYYESLTDNNTSEPGAFKKWGEAPKFQTEIYNDLWCRYLAHYLSLIVIKNSFPFITKKIGSEGQIKINGDNWESTESKEQTSTVYALQARIEDAFENMHDFLIENKSKYSLYKGKDNEDQEETCEVFEDGQFKTVKKNSGDTIKHRHNANGSLWNIG